MIDLLEYLKKEIEASEEREKDYIEREEQAKLRRRESKQRQKHNLNLIAELKNELYVKEAKSEI